MLIDMRNLQAPVQILLLHNWEAQHQPVSVMFVGSISTWGKLTIFFFFTLAIRQVRGKASKKTVTSQSLIHNISKISGHFNLGQYTRLSRLIFLFKMYKNRKNQRIYYIGKCHIGGRCLSLSCYMKERINILS